MKPEAQQRSDWAPILNSVEGLVREPVENMIKSATPDEAYTLKGVNGWIEYKVGEAPKNHKRPIRKLSHWTGLQREWMRKRYLSPTIFLLLRIEDYDYILNTKEMFGIEDVPYNELKTEYSWRIPVNKIDDFWTLERMIYLKMLLLGELIQLPQHEE